MRDDQEPLHQREEPVQFATRVRVDVVETETLFLIGRWVPIVHEQDVDEDAVREPLELEVPVEPPTWVLPPEQDHEQRTQEQQASGTRRDVHGPLRRVDRPRGAAHAPEDDKDRDGDEDPEGGRQPVEWSVRVLHG